MSDSPSSDIRLANGRFAPGNPGGPGRPRAVDRFSEFDRFAAERGMVLVEAAYLLVKQRNVQALKMLLDRVWPVPRGRPVRIEVPEIRTAADLVAVGAAVTANVTNGELTPEEGAAVARLLALQGQVLEDAEPGRRPDRPAQTPLKNGENGKNGSAQ